MAKHFWLGQRALRLQEFCFHMEFPKIENNFEKQFALYLRYQTTHERAFHKCLNDMQKLRAQQSRELAESNARRRNRAAEVRRQEMHEARLKAVQAKTELVKAKAAPIAARTPGNVPDNTADRVREVLPPKSHEKPNRRPIFEPPSGIGFVSQYSYLPRTSE
jgi:hypothetical protein